MTGARGGATLYSPDMLSLAVSLADFPLAPDLPLTGEARSRTCGSRVMLGCSIDDAGAIARVGVRASACAVGQAAAALFVHGARGRTRQDVASARAQLGGWLGGAGGMPDWPGIERLSPALAYPGRHGAIVLAWDAALAALPNA